MRMTQAAVLVQQNQRALKQKRTEWQHARNRAVRQERERVANIAETKRLFVAVQELECKLPAVTQTMHSLMPKDLTEDFSEQYLAVSKQHADLTQKLAATRTELNTRLRARQL